MGRARASADGEPVSRFNLTDQEREMHDRVWRFLVAPHAKDWFYDTAVELQRTRMTGATDLRFDSDRYYQHLRAQPTHPRACAEPLRDIGHDRNDPLDFHRHLQGDRVDRQRAIAVDNVSSAGRHLSGRRAHGRDRR